MRGGRVPRPRENDREGQYGRPGNAWQPRDRSDEPSAPRAPQLADKLQGEALYGVNPVLGALQAMRRGCHTLYVQEGQCALVHAALVPYKRMNSILLPNSQGTKRRAMLGFSC